MLQFEEQLELAAGPGMPMTKVLSSSPERISRTLDYADCFAFPDLPQKD